jgi:succinate dehydrogenase / fumarate reductase flavoprotein subunit
MEQYAPTLLDLAPRDMVARAMMLEIRAGRGIRGDRKIDDFLHLDTTHLGRQVLETKLPDITGFTRTYLGLDPNEHPIPVLPTAHYAMGGIPTDVHGRVMMDSQSTVCEGLYAAGECACVSVHGANRLGTNSLLDLVVFGRRAGIHIAGLVKLADRLTINGSAADNARHYITRLTDGKLGPQSSQLREKMEVTMMDDVGIYRNGNDMRRAIDTINELRRQYQSIRIQDTGRTFNTELLETIELGNLLDLSLLTAWTAQARQESRGAHSREDYPERDDSNGLKHSLAFLNQDQVRLDFKPVDTSIWRPKPRVY